MPILVVDLNINPKDALRYYQGKAQYIMCQSQDGSNVRLPATIIRKLISKDGVHGKFLVRYTADGKLESVTPVDRVR